MKTIKYFQLIAIISFSFFVFPQISSAHALSAAFTTIQLSENGTELTYSIDTLSVIEGLGGDKNNDGDIDKDELNAIKNRMKEWIEDGIVLEKEGKEQTGELTSLTVEQKGEKNVVTAHFTYPGYSTGETITLVDGIFFDGRNAASYNNFLTIDADGQISEAVLHGKNRNWTMIVSATQQEQQEPGTTVVKDKPVSTQSSWKTFLFLGMEHILTGYDHLLFLFALLLRKQTLKQYISMITAFTIAHSITLTLSVLGIVTLPSKFVETLIAISICYVAIENIFRKEITYRWTVTFAFGLIHGLGFASILREMNIPKHDLAVALFNFNIGIEIIQLLIVLLIIPILIQLQKLKKYRTLINSGSVLIFILGGIWVIQRLLV